MKRPGAVLRKVHTRRCLLPSEYVKSSSSVPVSPAQLARITTVKRLTTLPERSWKMPWASSVPLKYCCKSSLGVSCAYMAGVGGVEQAASASSKAAAVMPRRQ